MYDFWANQRAGLDFCERYRPMEPPERNPWDELDELDRMLDQREENRREEIEARKNEMEENHV